MSKPEAQKFFNKYLSEMGAVAATAGAGVGSAVAVDRMMHTDEDHAGEKIIVVKKSTQKTQMLLVLSLTSTEKKA